MENEIFEVPAQLFIEMVNVIRHNVPPRDCERLILQATLCEKKPVEPKEEAEQDG